jgi:hypothetical protein
LQPGLTIARRYLRARNHARTQAFEKLLDIIEDGEGLDGSAVVQDCLALALNLLEGNESNQREFREIGRCLQRLMPFVDVPVGEGSMWPVTTRYLHVLVGLGHVAFVLCVWNLSQIKASALGPADSPQTRTHTRTHAHTHTRTHTHTRARQAAYSS